MKNVAIEFSDYVIVSWDQLVLNKRRNKEPLVEINMGRDENGDAEAICPNILLPRVVQQVAKPEARQPYCGGVL